MFIHSSSSLLSFALLVLLHCMTIQASSHSTHPKCPHPVDICLLIDHTDRISHSEWNHSKQFCEDVTSVYVRNHPKNARVTVTSYSSSSKLELELKSGNDPHTIRESIKDISQSKHGHSNIIGALKRCQNQFRSSPHGTIKVLLIMSNHRFTDDPSKNHFDQVGAHSKILVAVGTDKEIEIRYRKYIRFFNVVVAQHYRDLSNLLSAVWSHFCPGCMIGYHRVHGTCVRVCKDLYYDKHRDDPPWFLIPKDCDGSCERMLEHDDGHQHSIMSYTNDKKAADCVVTDAEVTLKSGQALTLTSSCIQQLFFMKNDRHGESKLWMRPRHGSCDWKKGLHHPLDQSFVSLRVQCQFGKRDVSHHIAHPFSYCVMFRMKD